MTENLQPDEEISRRPVLAELLHQYLSANKTLRFCRVRSELLHEALCMLLMHVNVCAPVSTSTNQSGIASR